MALDFPASPSLNDFYVANGRRWQWNGTAWQRIPDPGAQGVQGDVGAQGFQGRQGAVGAQGDVGAQGAQGAVGAQGDAGAQGAVGAQGAAGAQGAVGAQGNQGRQGSPGAQGAVGAQGAQGAQGVQGAAAAGANGKILQVVQVSKTSAQSFTSSTGWYDISGLSASITPSATSSKVLILGFISIGGSVGVRPKVKLLRGSTDILLGDSISGSTQATTSSSIDDNSGGDVATINYVDSPSTTSSTTYKFQIWQEGGNQTYVNRSNNTGNVQDWTGASTIILMEVGA